MVDVLVTDQNKLESSLRQFKKKTQKEGIIKEARARLEFEKPSERKKRKRKESIARSKKKKR